MSSGAARGKNYDLNTAGFERRFGAEIRVLYDRSRVLAEDLPVERQPIGSCEELGALGLPWYLDKEGKSCNYDRPGAGRLKLAEAAELLGGALSHRAAAVEEKTGELALEPGAIRRQLPAYRHPNETILLDGCHTAVALMLGGFDLKIELWAICGPEDSTYFADLLVGS